MDMNQNLPETVTKIGLSKNDILKSMMSNIASKENIDSKDKHLTNLMDRIINDPKIANPITEFEKALKFINKTTMNI